MPPFHRDLAPPFGLQPRGRSLSTFAGIVVWMAVTGVRVGAVESVSSGTNARSVHSDRATFFETRIRPLLAEHCFECHSADAEEPAGGLRLDHGSLIRTGGDTGPAIVVGDAKASLLMAAVRYEEGEMPPTGQLSPEAIEDLRLWIDGGAYWPDEPVPSHQSTDPFDLQKRRREHWCWQPITDPPVPTIDRHHFDGDAVRDAMDAFVIARRLEHHIDLPTATDRRKLFRRWSFDLTGLPPSPEAMWQYLADDSPSADAAAVDRMLASPDFGVRWGRHWLDLVRYAETRGHEFDDNAGEAFRYRDYVIAALNADVPYDQFLREQIAGDLMDVPRRDPSDGSNQSMVGTGFWHLGVWVHSPVDVLKDHADRLDDMIDVFGKSMMGLTIACARCHDHKFDAISTADYYALTGILRSSNFRYARYESDSHNADVAEQIQTLDRHLRDELSRVLPTTATPVIDTPPMLGPARPMPGSSGIDGAPFESVQVIDLADVPADAIGWDGHRFGCQPIMAGQWVWKAREDGSMELRCEPLGGLVSDPAWRGLKSRREGNHSSRSDLNRVARIGQNVRSPTMRILDGRVAIRVTGKGQLFACVEGHRLVRGPLHGRTIVTLDGQQDWVYMDLTDYVGCRVVFEFTPAKDAALTVRWIVDGVSGNTLQPLRELEAEQRERAGDADRALASAMKSDATVGELVDHVRRERRRLSHQIQRTSRVAMAMIDGSGWDDAVSIRGNAHSLGKPEPRHFLTAIPTATDLFGDLTERRSGRWELAQSVTDAANPLTARVVVNRIWKHLIGNGIVASPDDFGVQGSPPSHPRLLDHLASRMMREGWSIKSMVRHVALSSTYRITSDASPENVRVDPSNRWLHHRRVRRLEAEAIRDSLVWLSGDGDRTIGGPSVPVHLTDFMQGRGRPSKNGPPNGDGRRSIYLEIRRNFLSPLMTAFDAPVPSSTRGKRNGSNVPAQSLVLLNDPVVRQWTDAWSDRLGHMSTESSAEPPSIQMRIATMYEMAFGRPPSSQESSVSTRFVQEATDAESGLRELAHALINTKGFLFVR